MSPHKFSNPCKHGLIAWTILALGFFAVIFTHAYMPAAHGYDITGHLLGRDFVDFWLAAKLTLHGRVDTIFSLSDFIAAMRATFGEHYPFHWWSYPPTMLLLMFPFGLLPYFPALLLWSLLGIAALLCIPHLRPHWFLLLLAPASLVNLLSGMNGFFTAALFLGGIYLSDSRPKTAGFLIGLLTVKPHLGLLLPLYLLTRKHYLTMAIAMLTSIGLIALSLLLWGAYPWQQFIGSIVPHHRAMLNELSNFYIAMMPGLFVSARLAGISVAAAWALHGTVALAATVISLRIARWEHASARAVLALTLTAFLITPYGYNYDMVAIAAATLLYLATAQATLLQRITLGFVWAVPMACYYFNLTHMPIMPLFLIAALAALTARPLADSQSPHSTGPAPSPANSATPV